MNNNIKKINLGSIQSGFASVKTSVKSGTQRGLEGVKSGTQRGLEGVKSGAQSVKNGTQRGFENVKSGAKNGIGSLGARSGAFSAAFTTTVSSFASGGQSLTNRLSGLPTTIRANDNSWKTTGAVRNFLGQATQLGISGLKKLAGFGGALVGVFAGLGVGAKAFATYKKPVAEKENMMPMTTAAKKQWGNTLVSHPVSVPNSPASPTAASSDVKVDLQVGDAGVKMNLTTQEQKAAA